MTTAEKINGFGSFLRNQRRAKGISIETVSEKTKIRIEVLRHIENEDLGRLPSPTFVKGFVRAYGQAVGADIEEALRLFAASCAAHAECDLASAPPKQRAPFWRGFLLACTVLVLLVLITLSIARRMETPPAATPSAERETAKSPPATPSATPPPAQTPTPQPAASVTATPVPAADNANATGEAPKAVQEAQPAKLVLQVAASELTWLRVISDGHIVKEITMKPEDRMTFEAEQRFDLVIGNAGGVQLTLNDKPLPSPGKPGRVVSLKLP